MTKTVLIIDDNAFAAQMEQYLKPLGFAVEEHLRADGAEERVAALQPDVILLDLHFPGDDEKATRTTGGKLHTTLRECFPYIPILIFSIRPDDDAIPLEQFDLAPLGRIGKPDFTQRGWAAEYALQLDRVIAEHGRSSGDYSKEFGFLVGETRVMREFARRLGIAARTDRSILLCGETGTGKELAARAVHKASGRSGKFVVARIGSIPPELVGSALFGHAEGAFPGAYAASAGWIAEAEGGTLFLDEIGDIPAEPQAALLSFLDDRSFRPPGTPAFAADVRIVSATQRALHGLVAENGIRGDMLGRLREVELSLPPLRDRLEDIPALFARAVEAFNATANIQVSGLLRSETHDKLRVHDWPGNIRQFNDVLRAAIIWTRNHVLLPEDVDFDIVPEPTPAEPAAPGAAEAPHSPVEQTTADLAALHFARIEEIPQGQARYDEYKALPLYLLAPVAAHIKSALRSQKRSGDVKQIEFSYYFFGDGEGSDRFDTVRRFFADKNVWQQLRDT